MFVRTVLATARHRRSLVPRLAAVAIMGLVVGLAMGSGCTDSKGGSTGSSGADTGMASTGNPGTTGTPDVDPMIVLHTPDGLGRLEVATHSLPPGTDPAQLALVAVSVQETSGSGARVLGGYDLQPDGLVLSSPAAFHWKAAAGTQRLGLLHVTESSIESPELTLVDTDAATGEVHYMAPISHFSLIAALDLDDVQTIWDWTLQTPRSVGDVTTASAAVSLVDDRSWDLVWELPVSGGTRRFELAMHAQPQAGGAELSWLTVIKGQVLTRGGLDPVPGISLSPEIVESRIGIDAAKLHDHVLSFSCAAPGRDTVGFLLGVNKLMFASMGSTIFLNGQSQGGVIHYLDVPIEFRGFQPQGNQSVECVAADASTTQSAEGEADAAAEATGDESSDSVTSGDVTTDASTDATSEADTSSDAGEGTMADTTDVGSEEETGGDECVPGKSQECCWYDVEACNTGVAILNSCPDGLQANRLERCSGGVFTPGPDYLQHALSSCPDTGCPTNKDHVVWRKIECCFAP